MDVERIREIIRHETAKALMPEEPEAVRAAFRQVLARPPHPDVSHMVGMNEEQVRAEVRRGLASLAS